MATIYKNQALLILPHQLYENLPSYFKGIPVFLVEHEHYFTRLKFHKQKLVLHRATMQMYKDHLQKKKHNVTYLDFKQSKKLFGELKKQKITTLHFFDPTDIPLENQLKEQADRKKIDLMSYESPNFLSPLDWLEEELDGKESFRMQNFYIKQRKQLNILMNGDKPTGGKWSYDQENRKPLSDDVEIPKLKKPAANKYVKEAQKYVEKHFAKNYGDISQFIYPTTFNGAKRWLDNFLKHRLKNFGTHQDAMLEGEHFLFHSVLAPILNIGLLNPDYIVEKTLAYAGKHRTPINNLEGFIRQIIGWREFIRGVYIVTEGKQHKENFFKHKRKLPKGFWRADTGIDPIDDILQKLDKAAYAHHIERLMILGNFMLLSEIHPDEVYKWFMELFIDSYDWVMVPNVYGMSQYADGGWIVNKPCISGSNYVRKMSNYKKGDWCDIWNALYWYFIWRKKRIMARNARLQVTFMHLERMKKSVLQEHLKIAKKYLKK